MRSLTSFSTSSSERKTRPLSDPPSPRRTWTRSPSILSVHSPVGQASVNGATPSSLAPGTASSDRVAASSGSSSSKNSAMSSVADGARGARAEIQGGHGRLLGSGASLPRRRDSGRSRRPPGPPPADEMLPVPPMITRLFTDDGAVSINARPAGGQGRREPGSRAAVGIRPGRGSRRASHPASRLGRCGDRGRSLGATRAGCTVRRMAGASCCRRSAGDRTGPVGIEASMPTHWGFGGIVADGGVTAADVRLVLADLAGRRIVRQGIRPNPRHGRLYAEHAPVGSTTIARRAHVLDLAGGVDVVWKGFSDSRRRAVRKAERRRDRRRVRLDRSPLAGVLRAVRPLRSAMGRAAARTRPTRTSPHPLPRHPREVAADRPPSERGLSPVGRPARRPSGRVDHRPVRHERALHAGCDGQRARRARCAANDLLMWQAIQAACAIDAGSFHFGESGARRRSSDYKERFGARAFDYPELRLEQVPITRADHAAAVGGQARDRLPRTDERTQRGGSSAHPRRSPLARGPAAGTRGRAPGVAALPQRLRARDRHGRDLVARLRLLDPRRPPSTARPTSGGTPR